MQNGLSQEDLALKSNLDRTYITYVENAKKNVTVETLYKITKALDVSLSDFFDMESFTVSESFDKTNINLSLNDLVKGSIYNNKELSSIFKCSTQGGIRISSKNKTATLISHSASSINPYNDSEIKEDGSFIYTGMGLKGNQLVKPSNQNGKVGFSKDNGYRLFYFISINKNKYKFIGEVKLTEDYYFEDELDIDGNMRKVVKFPLIII